MNPKDFRLAQHSCVSKVTSVDPFSGPSSDLYTRTHEILYKLFIDLGDKGLFLYTDVENVA
jgi:hypothetical protein